MSPERIRRIMAELKVTKRQLAKAVGVSHRTVDGWLSKRPPSRTAAKLIESLAE